MRPVIITLYFMRKIIIAQVIFKLYESSLSQKNRGYISGIRPNHFIDELGATIIGEIEIEDGKIDLGETKEAIVTYPYIDESADDVSLQQYKKDIMRVLKPGLKYKVMEGSRIVGEITVVEVDKQI